MDLVSGPLPPGSPRQVSKSRFKAHPGGAPLSAGPVRQALAWHRQGLDFADALHLLRSEGCARFASLDRALAKAASDLDLQPAVYAL